MCCQQGELGTDIILLSTLIPRRGMLRRLLSVVFNRLFSKGARPIRGATIYVVRINKKGGLALARPCDNCMEELSRQQVKRVIYSVPKGYVMEKI